MTIEKYIVVGRLSAAAMCIVCACVLGVRGSDDWGWFLFVACLLGMITYDKDTGVDGVEP